jgi:hypothetical protein
MNYFLFLLSQHLNTEGRRKEGKGNALSSYSWPIKKLNGTLLSLRLKERIFSILNYEIGN